MFHIDFKKRKISFRVAPDNSGRVSPFLLSSDGYCFGIVDDVVFSDNEAVGIDNETGAGGRNCHFRSKNRRNSSSSAAGGKPRLALLCFDRLRPAAVSLAALVRPGRWTAETWTTAGITACTTGARLGIRAPSAEAVNGLP